MGRRFNEAVQHMQMLEQAKQQAYAPGPNPHANYDAAGRRFDVPYWQAAMMRIDEKLERVKVMLLRGQAASKDDCEDVAVLILKIYEWSTDDAPDSIEDSLPGDEEKAVRG